MEKRSHNLTAGDQVELNIEKLTPNGGRGLARHNGFVVFTPFTAPGDKVLVEIEKLKKSYAEARVVEILEASSIRVKPECEYFGECGGCTLQMLSSDDQLTLKQSFIEDMLKKLDLEPTEMILPIESSPKELRYRNRIQLHKKNSELGYYKKESHSFVAIDDCLIADEKLIDKFQELKSTKKDERFELALTKEDNVVVRSKSSKNPKDLLFSQVNEGVNQKLKEHLKSCVNKIDLRTKSVLDLYAGSGNFTEVLAKDCDSVTAVELSKPSVAQAKREFKNVKFLASSVESFLQDTDSKFDVVLMDPPRQGLGSKVVSSLKKLKPKHLFYISCDPATLERDLRLLLDEYSISHVKAFDMFPQTSHIETFVHLQSKV